MSDRITFAVSAIPIETLTTENSTSKDVIASEINRSLSGTGESESLTDYSLTAAQQGYKDGTVNYFDAVHTSGGAQLSTERSPDFIFIRNTGFKYSSATTLGAVTKDCVMVAIEDASNALYYEVAWLKPGQAIVLPGGGSKYSIADFGGSGGDLHYLNTAGGTDAPIFLRTYLPNGTAASDGNAVEFLLVT